MNHFEIIWHGFEKLVNIKNPIISIFQTKLFFIKKLVMMQMMPLKTKVNILLFLFSSILFSSIVTLNASGEPVKKERSLETHCGWLCLKLYVFNNLFLLLISILIQTLYPKFSCIYSSSYTYNG